MRRWLELPTWLYHHAAGTHAAVALRSPRLVLKACGDFPSARRDAPAAAAPPRPRDPGETQGDPALRVSGPAGNRLAQGAGNQHELANERKIKMDTTMNVSIDEILSALPEGADASEETIEVALAGVAW